MAATETTSSESTSTSIVDGIRSALGTLGQLLTYGVYLAMTLAWVGFWGLVARLHLLQGEWVSLTVTSTLALVPVPILVWYGRDFVGEAFDSLSVDRLPGPGSIGS